jgi:hypothetical protein
MVENKAFKIILILNMIGCAIYFTCNPTGEPQSFLYNLVLSISHTLAFIGILTLLKW